MGKKDDQNKPESSGLTDQEKQVLKERFGVDFGTDGSLDGLADQFGRTRKRLRSIERKMLKRILHDAVRANSPDAKCWHCGRMSADVRIMLCTQSGSTICEDCVSEVLEAPDE